MTGSCTCPGVPGERCSGSGNARCLPWRCFWQAPALAATIPVAGTCTLVDAITAANTDTATGDCLAGSGDDTLTLTNSSVHTLTSVNNTTFGPTGLPVVSSTITIEGHGSTIKRDSADPDQFRIFAINSGGNLTLNETTVSGGLATGGDVPAGGGVYNGGGTAMLTNSTISGNSAYSGGGVYNNYGTATLTNSTVSGNSASVGGGVHNRGIATLTNSTVSGNSAGFGGGVANSAAGSTGSIATLTNSTVSGNSAYSGGGVFNDNTSYMTLTNSTVSGNSAGFRGGGVYNRFATLNLANTILANSPSGGDCNNFGGALNASGVNLVEDGSCDPGALTGDPKLGPLAPNGGPTETHALLAGSLAIDAVTDDSCPPPNEDQRGVARPQDGDGDTFADCDIGSFEALFCNGLVPTIVGTSGNNTLTGTNKDDVIHGLGGNDIINGGNGNDTICGGEGTDTLHGDNGNDRLFGENGNDVLNGNNGTDALDGGAGSGDTCNGGNGSDTGANCEPFNQ